jgi:ligand-binding sensor domain-containing protein/signal transduction histidine kinase
MLWRPFSRSTLWKLCVFIGATLALVCFSGGGANAATPSRFSVRVWQSDEGLPNNSVYAIAQSAEGYLWVGTHEGLARFDGVRFTIVDETVAPELRRAWVTALCVASDGSLWAACDGAGVTRLKDGKAVRYSEADGLPSNQTRCLLESSDGSIWIGSEAGVTRFKDGKFTTLTEKNGLGDNSVRELCEAPDGVLRIATRRGLSNLNTNGVISTMTFGLGTVSNALKAVWQDRKGNIWVSSNEGVTMAGTNERSFFSTGEGLPNRVSTDIREDRGGRIWIGTYSGVACVEAGKVIARPLNETGLGDLVWTVYEDREDNIWVGGRDGLYRIRPARFTSYTSKEGLSSDNVMSVCEDRAGAVWIGTWGGGVNVLKGDSISVYGGANGLTHDSVLSLFEGNDGSMWVGMDFDGGVNRLKGEMKNSFVRPQNMINAAVRVIYEDSRQELWVGTSRGLSVITKGKAKNYSTAQGLAGNQIMAIHEDAQHRTWVATDGGLSCREGNSFTNFTMRDGLSHNWVNAIYEDGQGALWFGTRAGLNHYKDGKWRSLSSKNGLFSDEIYEIVEDDYGFFWMTCRTGLFRVDKAEIELFLAGKAKLVTSTAYGKADGLVSVQFNGVAKPSGWKGRNGRLWFPTIHGVVAVESQMKPNNKPPMIVVEQVLADGKKIAGIAGDAISADMTLLASSGPALRIQPGRGELEIQYTALSLRASEKNRFKYRLEGVDPDWMDAGTRRAAYYNNIPPGSYRFRVLASNNDGVWNEAGTALDLIFLPHYWQTIWFKMLIPLVAGFLLWLWYRLRVAQLRKIERLRIQIAADLHDDVGSRLTKVAMVTELVERETLSSDRSRPHIEAIARTTREVIQAMDEIVWTINPKNDTLENLANYLFQYAQEYFQNTSVRCRLDFPPKLPDVALSTEERHNLFMAFKEALNNVLKHSDANEVRVSLTANQGKIGILISDNGKGFDVKAINGSGDGLMNMNSRLKRVGGHLDLESRPGAGTRVQMEAPID